MKRSCKHLQPDDDSLMISLVDSQFHDPMGRKLKHPPFHVSFGAAESLLGGSQFLHQSFRDGWPVQTWEDCC